jgi:carboxylesterase type B
VHGLEIPFVFDTLDPDLTLFGPLLGEEPPQQLADAMHAAWVAFATSGDLGWPRYDLNRNKMGGVAANKAGRWACMYFWRRSVRCLAGGCSVRRRVGSVR